MKTYNLVWLAVTVGIILHADRPAEASPYSFSGPDINAIYSAGASGLNQLIADNSPVGVGYGFNFTDTGLSISAVALTVNMSGGYNGDMYAYLQHNGTVIELFGPESFSSGGASGSTLNLTLSSGSDLNSLSEATSINLASGLTYTASGNLSSFTDDDPNGLWTLYFADQNPGDTMILNSLNLSITAAMPVPEPGSLVLLCFAGMLLAGNFLQTVSRKFKLTH